MAKATSKNQSEPGWVEREVAFAQRRWAEHLSAEQQDLLRVVLLRDGLCVSAGEIQLLDGRLYVNHAGLLRLARRNRCGAIETEILAELSQPEQRRWVVRAQVFRSPAARRAFIGLGDADPSNVSSLVRGAELRVAETRAVNRALRKAYAIGLCSSEEIGGSAEATLDSSRPGASSAQPVAGMVPTISVRDRLKLILRDHQLDPAGVLRYACQYLNVPNLDRVSPPELDRFAEHLERFAVANRVWLDAELDRAARAGVASAEIQNAVA